MDPAATVRRLVPVAKLDSWITPISACGRVRTPCGWRAWTSGPSPVCPAIVTCSRWSVLWRVMCSWPGR